MTDDQFCAGVFQLVGEFGDCVAWVCWCHYCTSVGCSECYNWIVDIIRCEESDDIVGLNIEVMFETIAKLC